MTSASGSGLQWPLTHRTLKDPATLKAREALLDAGHHAPLRDYVLDLRAQLKASGLDVPHLDPLGGGTHAHVLYLLEAPGPRAAGGRGGSGFISMDNDDQTAQNVFELTREAGLPRQQVLSWNIVPWYVGDHNRIRAVRAEEVAAGREHLEALLAILTGLKVIVTFGRPAARGWQTLAPKHRALVTLSTWHPSPLALNGRPERREHVLATLRLARQLEAASAGERQALLAAWRSDAGGPR